MLIVAGLRVGLALWVLDDLLTTGRVYQEDEAVTHTQSLHTLKTYTSFVSDGTPRERAVLDKSPCLAWTWRTSTHTRPSGKNFQVF